MEKLEEYLNEKIFGFNIDKRFDIYKAMGICKMVSENEKEKKLVLGYMTGDIMNIFLMNIFNDWLDDYFKQQHSTETVTLLITENKREKMKKNKIKQYGKIIIEENKVSFIKFDYASANFGEFQKDTLLWAKGIIKKRLKEIKPLSLISFGLEEK